MAVYRERIYPQLLDLTSRIQAIEQIRHRVVENVSGHVLEIGAGTGVNLLHYPDSVTSLTTVDPNPGMYKRIRQRIKYVEFPVDTRKLDSEQLPMKDGAFDCAVTTFTLCSIPRVERSLAEVHRVLKTGGRLFFAEHGLSDKPEQQKWQRRFNPLAKLLCDGCHLDRPIVELIKSAGFLIDHVENSQLNRVPWSLGYLYEGVAIK